MNVSTRTESGFTLIELIVSSVIGLLIIGAVSQVFLTSSLSLKSQQSGSDIQADGVFGVLALKKSIRMANYGAIKSAQSQFIMNDQTIGGGISFGWSTDQNNLGNNNIRAVLPDNSNNRTALVSSSSVGPSNLKAGSAVSSDSLVIQRRLEADSFDCEGNAVNAGFFLVERYFVRKDDLRQPGEPEELALACNAVTYGILDVAANTVNAITDDDKPNLLTRQFRFVDATELTDAQKKKGEILINRVDHFRVLLGIETGSNVSQNPANSRIRYVSINDYRSNTFPSPKPSIVAVKIGLVVRATNPSNLGPTNSAQRFDVLDQTGLSLKTDIAGKAQYQRQKYESTILIRNARGA